MASQKAIANQLITVVTLLLAALLSPPAVRSQELSPGSHFWERFIDEHLADAEQSREAGDYGAALASLRVAAAEARRARPSTSSINDEWYVDRTTSEAEALVSACAEALDRELDEFRTEFPTWRAVWLADRSIEEARRSAEALESVPESADELVGDLRIMIRTYLGELYGQPIRRFFEPQEMDSFGIVVDSIAHIVDKVCQSSSPVDALKLMENAITSSRDSFVDEPRRAASSWTDLVATSGSDVPLAGLRPSSLRRLVGECEQQVAAWETEMAELDAGGAQRLHQATIAAGNLRVDLHQRHERIREIENTYRSARELWKGLDREAATASPPPTWSDRAWDDFEGLEAEKSRLEGLLGRTREDGSARAVLDEIRDWVKFLEGPEMLGRIETFRTEADTVAADIERRLDELDDHLDRGDRCFDALYHSAVSGSPLPATPTPLQTQGVAPSATPTPAPPSLTIAPPVPTPTPNPNLGAAASTVDPDVAGGLKITGPTKIGVGWSVSYSATDHGGRSVSEVSWHAMADNIHVSGGGSVEGLRPGRATIMATAHGMRAYFDFEVVADDGAPATPDGPPSLTTPVPAAVVVTTLLPTATPTPSSTPPPSTGGRTTDWAEPSPTPWYVPEEPEPGPGGIGPDADDDDGGGGFDDLGTEVDAGTGPAGGDAVTHPESRAQTPGEPPVGGGFEDLGTDVGPTDDEGLPTEPDGSGPDTRQPDTTGTEAPVVAPPRPEVVLESDPGSEPYVAPAAADDDTGGSSDPSGLTLMGETFGQGPSPIADGSIPLLPPPGNRDSAPPDGSSPGGSSPPPPGNDGQPFIPNRVNVSGAGQPAAYHIFATCSRLGWAGALSTYSVGPADAAIADHLLVAGEHAMWANRTSYTPNPAWPDWQARRGLWGDWAARLARTRDPVFRSQMAHHLSTGHEPLAQNLAIQTVDDTYRTPTCDAEYCRLGFLMAWGQQALAIADEARRNGNTQVAEAAAIDGEKRLRLARGRLPGYERIIPASGRCADFTAVGGHLAAAIGGRSTSAARAAWEEALRAVMALGAVVPPSDSSLLGGWVLADGRLVTVTQQGDSMVGVADDRVLFRVRPEGDGLYTGQGLIATRSGETERSQWYDGLTIRVERDDATATIGQFGFTMTRAGESAVPGPMESPAASSNSRCPTVHFNDNIEGEWAWSECCPLNFSASGSEWIGAFTRLNDDMREIGHRIGQPFMRLRSTGPRTYVGTKYTHWSSSPVIPVDITVIVAGSSLILKEDRFYGGGLVRRSNADTSLPLHLSGFWIGCASTQPDTMECSVNSDPHFDLKFSNANGAERLRQDGYPMIVFGPVTGNEAISWVFEHHNRRLCLDSNTFASGVQESPPVTIPVPPPNGGTGDLQMMGVEASEGSGGGTP